MEAPPRGRTRGAPDDDSYDARLHLGSSPPTGRLGRRGSWDKDFFSPETSLILGQRGALRGNSKERASPLDRRHSEEKLQSSWLGNFQRRVADQLKAKPQRGGAQDSQELPQPQTSLVMARDFFHELSNEIRGRKRKLLLFTRTFLPALLVECLEYGFWSRLEQGEAVTKSYTGAVIAIEFTGLGLLTSYLLQRLNGEMQLSKVLDKLFTFIMDVILSYRGDIIQFTGSSLTVFFEATADAEKFRHACGSVECHSHTPDELACLRATACCLDLQKRMTRFQALDLGLADDCPHVSLACGLGTGDVTLIGLCCGHRGRGSRTDYKCAFAGDCMCAAAQASALAAKQTSPIVLSKEAWDLAQSFVVEGPVITEGLDFHCVLALDVKKHTYPMVRHAAQQSWVPKTTSIRDFDADAINRRLSMSLKFLQYSVMVDSVAGNHYKVNELRQVSMVFFHVQGIDATSEEGARILGPLVKQFMRVTNLEEGCMLKIVADDRGLLFYFAFGLPPLVHLDDPKRACKTCIGLVEACRDAEVVCSAGVVTDRLLCGVIGNDKRREYSVMGSGMQACASISAAAEPSSVLVDETTFRHCSGFLDFFTVNPIVGGPRLEPISVFRMLCPQSGDSKDDRPAVSPSRTSELSIMNGTGTESLSPSHRFTQNVLMFSPPCTPPWLSKLPTTPTEPRAIKDPLFPTLWTGIWCDRPSPNAHTDVPASLPSAETARPEWKSAVQVRLPWPARSIASGGVSPVPAFSSWKVLSEAEKRMEKLHADGGGTLCLVGPFGSGKTELAEHLVCSAVRNKDMQPVFGAMELRACHGRSAIQGLLHGILALLEPSGQLRLDEEFKTALAREVTGDEEQQALQDTGIGNAVGSHCPPRYISDDSRSAPSSPGSQNNVLTSPGSPGSPGSPLPRSSSHPSCKSSSDMKLVRRSESSDASKESSTMSWPNSFDNEKVVHVSAQQHDVVLVTIAIRLMRRLLERGPVVVTLRVSQGTSRLDSNINSFWVLARSLEALALNRGVGLHHMIVIVVCRPQHLQHASSDDEKTLFVNKLNYGEVRSYIHQCLGIEQPNDEARPDSLSKGDPEVSAQAASDDSPVPWLLVRWLSQLANVPRYIEEGLTQLHRTGMIKVVNSRCIVKSSLDSVNISDWVHTSMVARVISDAEALSSEMQEVLHVATTLGGPFSTLDLAAATRTTFSRDAGYLTMHQCVMRLMACKELVRLGLLEPATAADWRKHETDYPVYVYDGTAPSWIIPSAIVHQVIRAALFQTSRMELKRAILTNRVVLGFGQSPHMSRKSSASMSISSPWSGEKMALKQKKWREQHQKYAQIENPETICEEEVHGVPLSCLVTPIWDDGESDFDSESGTEMGPRLSGEFAASATMLDLGQIDEEDYWRHVSLSDLLPMRTFRCLRLLLKFYCLTIVAFGSDLTIMLDGSQQRLDSLLVLAMVLVFFDLVGNSCSGRASTARIEMLCSLLILLMIFFEVTWAFGMKSDEFLVTRRRTDSLFRMLCYMIKFGACTCRLSAEIQIWLRKIPWRGCIESFRRRQGAHKVLPTPEDGGDGSGNLGSAMTGWRSQQLMDIGNGMTYWVVVSLTLFTVVTIGTAKLTDYSHFPDEDLSMLTWVQLISNHLVNGTGSLASAGLAAELGLFDSFYKDMEYGPFRLCQGIADLQAESLQDQFLCKDIVWTVPSQTFSEPARKGYELNVRSDTLQASFDFTSSAKLEALLRCLLFLSMMLATLAISVAIDYMVNRLVIDPLTHVFSAVRYVIVKLQEHLPELELKDDVEDVVLLERAVERVMRLVADVRQHDPGRSKEAREVEAWTGQGVFGWTSRNSEMRQSSLSLPVGNVSSLSSIPALGSTDTAAFAESIARPEDTESLSALGVDLEDVYSWSFNIFGLSKAQQSGVTAWLLYHNNASCKLNHNVVDKFVEAVSARYVDKNPYHNWRHAVDVHHTLCRKCSILGARKFIPRVDIFALQVAAVGHDAGHPGFNNPFLEETAHELALRYNDRSPLENMHCALLFEIMHNNPEARIFAGFSIKQWKEIRQVCIEVILNTDNSKHFKHIQEMEMVYAANCDTLSRPVAFPHTEELELLQSELNRQLTLNTLMHGADIANACKPWALCTQWAELVISEFFRQGDEEKRLGIPVQALNDRDTLNKPSSQVAFIKFFIAPFNKAMVKILPPLWQLTELLEANLARWHTLFLNEVWMEESKRETTVKQAWKLMEELREHADIAQARSSHIVSKKDQALTDATKRWLLKEKEERSASPGKDESSGDLHQRPSRDLLEPRRPLTATVRSPFASEEPPAGVMARRMSSPSRPSLMARGISDPRHERLERPSMQVDTASVEAVDTFDDNFSKASTFSEASVGSKASRQVTPSRLSKCSSTSSGDKKR